MQLTFLPSFLLPPHTLIHSRAQSSNWPQIMPDTHLLLPSPLHRAPRDTTEESYDSPETQHLKDTLLLKSSPPESFRVQDPDSGVNPALPVTDCTTLTMRPRKGDVWTGPLQPSHPPPCPPSDLAAALSLPATWLGARAHHDHLNLLSQSLSGVSTSPRVRRTGQDKPTGQTRP